MRVRIAAIALLTSVCGCATITITDRDAETAALANQLGIPASSIQLVSRCQYAMVPKGVSSGAFAAGVCMFANGALHIRVIDATTGKSEPYGSFGRAEIESVSLYVGLPINEVQVRLPQYVLAMIMRPDGGVGFNDSATRQMFGLLEAAGNQVVSSSRAIDIGGGGGGMAIPLIIPKK